MIFTTWTRKDRRIYEHSTCLICGSAYGICQGEHKAHRPSTCKACGTPQCWTHGLSCGQCSVCYIGLLDAFSRHKCGYKGCSNDAVAAVPRVKYACAEHLGRAQVNGRRSATVGRMFASEYIAAWLVERDKSWEQITFDMDSVARL